MTLYSDLITFFKTYVRDSDSTTEVFNLTADIDDAWFAAGGANIWYNAGNTGSVTADDRVYYRWLIGSLVSEPTYKTISSVNHVAYQSDAGAGHVTFKDIALDSCPAFPNGAGDETAHTIGSVEVDIDIVRGAYPSDITDVFDAWLLRTPSITDYFGFQIAWKSDGGSQFEMVEAGGGTGTSLTIIYYKSPDVQRLVDMATVKAIDLPGIIIFKSLSNTRSYSITGGVISWIIVHMLPIAVIAETEAKLDLLVTSVRDSIKENEMSGYISIKIADEQDQSNNLSDTWQCKMMLEIKEVI